MPELVVDGLRLPELLAGLRVVGDHVRIERRAVDLAVEDRDAAIQQAAAGHLEDVGSELEFLLPDLPAGQRVDRDRRGVRRHVHHAVVDDRLRLLALRVVQAVVPDRNQLGDVALVDRLQRAVALVRVPHAIGEHAAGVMWSLRRSSKVCAMAAGPAHSATAQASSNWRERFAFMMSPSLSRRLLHRGWVAAQR